MEFGDYISLVARRKIVIIFFVISFLILAIILTLLQPLKYGSNAQVLIIQNFTNLDPYQASKSSEYLSNILARVVYSNSFFENLLDSGYYVNESYFGQTAKERMKIWEKTISAHTINDSGIIALAVYHTDRSQAELIARAAVYTLQTKNSLYHGGGDNVSIKVIDDPVTSAYPVKPDLILNFSLAFALGLIFSFIYIYLLPEGKYSNIMMPKFFEKPALEQQKEDEVFAPAAPEASAEMFQNQIRPAEPAPVSETMEQIIARRKEKYNENINGQNIENNNYDDLDIHEEIVQQGSMNNIFGKPYSDDL